MFHRCKLMFVVLLGVWLAGCSSFFSGSREVPISTLQKNQLKNLNKAGPPVIPWVYDGEPGTLTVVVAFDGTNNNRLNVDSTEKATVVGRLYENVRTFIGAAPGTLTAKAPVEAFYYIGPGCPTWIACPFDSALGWSTWFTARQALKDVQAAVLNQPVRPTEIRVVAIGFSRGAATARVFLNELSNTVGLEKDGLKVRSYAVLFDTVATGLATQLDLDFPPDLELAFHFVALNETRRFFGLVVDGDDDYELNPDVMASYYPRRIYTVEVPGAHSDLGDSYKRGAGPAVTQYAQTILAHMGLLPPLGDYDCEDPLNLEQPGCRLMDEGLHDSRGWIDHWLQVPSPYGCFNVRHRKRIESRMSQDKVVELNRRLLSRMGHFPENNGNLYRFRANENYLFTSQGGPTPQLTPVHNRAGLNSVIVGQGEGMKVVFKGLNDGQVFPVPGAVLRQVATQRAPVNIELNVVTGTPRWIVNDCMPDED
ncbi:hypothetical protein [Pseudomonas mucidolens]|uniref:hypothetical protein n=1 Tax=Pseudomonas mucidolens TaxID=46679 RepID=UPI0030DC8CAA